MDIIEHKVVVTNRRVKATLNKSIPQYNVGVDILNAEFDDQWDNLDNLWVIFSNGTIIKKLPFVNGMDIPWEVLTEVGTLRTSFVGYRGEDIIVTEIMSSGFAIKQADNMEGDEPLEPTPTEFQAILAEIAKVREEIEAGLLKGDKGDTGDQGPQGEEGPQGPQGIRGEKGETGEQGIQGETGEQGPQGIQGIQGVRGEKGEKGETGPQGPQGEPGPQGIQGEQGIQGVQGVKGDSPVRGVDYWTTDDVSELYGYLDDQVDDRISTLVKQIDRSEYDSLEAKDAGIYYIKEGF